MIQVGTVLLVFVNHQTQGCRTLFL